jgi:hypothetical protein
MPAVKTYTRVNFQNYPSTSTPLNATNLNKLDKGIDDLDDEVVTVKNAIENMSFDADSISYDNTSSGLQATDVQDAVDEINDNLDDVQNNLTELFTPDLSTYTAPTIYSSRIKNIVGGYKIVGDIVFINMNATINASLSASTSSWICTGLPAPTYTTAINASVGDNAGEGGTFARIQTDGAFILMPVRAISANQPLFLKGYYKKA